MKTKFRRQRLHDEVTEAMLGMIRNRSLGIGERLPPEPELAVFFDVSRGTLRAAVQELALLGFLEVRQGDGTYVRQPDYKDLVQPFRALLVGEPQLGGEMLQLRRMLEPEVASLAAKQCAEKDAMRLRELLQKQERLAAKGWTLAKEDLIFHHEIARIADNTLISNIFDMMHSLLREQGYEGSKATEIETVKQHKQIAEAIISHNCDGAKLAVIEHLNWVENVLREGGIKI